MDIKLKIPSDLVKKNGNRCIITITPLLASRLFIDLQKAMRNQPQKQCNCRLKEYADFVVICPVHD